MTFLKFVLKQSDKNMLEDQFHYKFDTASGIGCTCLQCYTMLLQLIVQVVTDCQLLHVIRQAYERRMRDNHCV